MKISMNWIGKYVDLNGVDLDELSNRFTLSVAEIDEVIKINPKSNHLYIARVDEVKPHPNADKLRIAICNMGNRSQEVVCGAPNLKPGIYSVLADTGAVVKDPKGEEFTLKETKIRDVKSSGMLVSPSEIGLSHDHGGIIELDNSLAAGTPLSEAVSLQDTIWDIDNKSLTHRPDLWGHVGIAREIASLLHRNFNYNLTKPDFSTEEPLQIKVEAPVLCPRYTAVKISKIKIKPSPLWLQLLLFHTDQRPVNNIVDFTNFVMFSTGNPLHAFDINHIKDNKIIIRRARPRETITTLDGEKHALIGDDLVIADNQRTIALAGVMGGQNSEVVESTSEIVLESASFKAGSIRKTASRHGIRTESSARFEKSLDPDFARQAAWMFCDIVDKYLPDSEISSKWYDLSAVIDQKVVIPISCDFIRQKLGNSISNHKIVKILKSLDFKIEEDKEQLKVTVPSYRATKDILIPEDLVEEIGRIFGYDNIKPQLPAVKMNKPFYLPIKKVQNLIRNELSIGLGFNEIMTYSFVKQDLLTEIGENIQDRLALVNPISKEEPVLRKNIVPNLLEAVLKNERNQETIRIYELGRVFKPEKGLPRQPQMAGIVIADPELESDEEGTLFFQMKFVLENLFSRLERGSVEFIANKHFDHPWIHPAKSAAVIVQDKTVGYLTSLNPYISKNLQIKSKVTLGILDLDLISSLEKKIELFQPLPKYPGISHDVSIIIDNKISREEVEKVLWQVEPQLTRQIECFDVYTSKELKNKRSLSFRILFQHPEKTLKQKKIKKIHKKIVKTVKEKTGGTILS
ncbi:MAG: phenylalanine--tRNA ligase subunit beta [Myxococcota bacterium]